jgi:hypothetical protein
MVTCEFFNHKDRVIVVRLTNLPENYPLEQLERVVFPKTAISFKAPEEAILELHSLDATTIHEDHISCRDLVRDRACQLFP